MENLIIIYHNWAVVVGAFFFGESIIITAAYLAAELGWNIFYLVLAAFFGTVISDTCWFFAGRFFDGFFSRKEYYRKRREEASVLLSRLTGERPFIALLYIKFLYGSRIAMIVYLAARNVSFRLFTIFNSLGTMLWLAVIIPLGYFAGSTIAPDASSLLNVVGAGIAVLIFSAATFKYFSRWLTKRLTKDSGQQL